MYLCARSLLLQEFDLCLAAEGLKKDPAVFNGACQDGKEVFCFARPAGEGPQQDFPGAHGGGCHKNGLIEAAEASQGQIAGFPFLAAAPEAADGEHLSFFQEGFDLTDQNDVRRFPDLEDAVRADGCAKSAAIALAQVDLPAQAEFADLKKPPGAGFGALTADGFPVPVAAAKASVYVQRLFLESREELIQFHFG